MKENAEDKLDENKDELDAYLFRYIDRFGENFPTCFVMGMGDEEMIGTIGHKQNDGHDSVIQAEHTAKGRRDDAIAGDGAWQCA